MAYRRAAIPMTLSDLEGRAPIAGLLGCDLLCSCAAVVKISTDTTHRAVSLQQLSVFVEVSERKRQKGFE